MDRRQFLKMSASAGLVTGIAPSFNLFAAPEDYTGNYYVVVQAQGGWDVTSFCDPKLNVPGEAEINHWARTGDIQTAGNIRYAPFADNQAFFDKYYQHMMVVNGVDAQTNSHDAGVVHNFSGRLAEGYPSLTALAASIHAPDLPIAYVNHGGYGETARLIRSSRLDNPSALINIINPNGQRWDPTTSHIPSADWQRVLNYHQARNTRLADATNLTPRQQYNRQVFRSSVTNGAILGDLRDNLAVLQGRDYDNTSLGQFQQQVDVTVASFISGVSASADMIVWGFDTHDDHDNLHSTELSYLTQGVDYLWEQAEAANIADRLVVVIASDFGRTPRYNDSNGKDHWPIGSTIFMQKNASWGNRVVGVTDEGHNALKINPVTLERDDNNGIIILPKDVMAAGRKLFGVDHGVISSAFPLREESQLDLFASSQQTAQLNDPRNSLQVV
ncbi:ribulose phosphate epimerase [Saccharobesus litoralis]|uniref:Ribulose phosphate epimerase n=1 Tax=Saccharobesus litoralis TaxID=2172099 RepID=A0A2S0VX77_9ALTE|nr:DUF1501 domain-containing protein [Saccharobesus litoralis]AWB68720.1 ribulose phosphate epimerase [Saccharobesus litoralis]